MISIAALSYKDPIIKSLTAFDEKAVTSDRVQIRIDLDKNQASWMAGSQITGVIKMNVIAPTDGKPAFPSSALTL